MFICIVLIFWIAVLAAIDKLSPLSLRDFGNALFFWYMLVWLINMVLYTVAIFIIYNDEEIPLVKYEQIYGVYFVQICRTIILTGSGILISCLVYYSVPDLAQTWSEVNWIKIILAALLHIINTIYLFYIRKEYEIET